MEILRSISGKIKSILLVVKSSPAPGKREWTMMLQMGYSHCPESQSSRKLSPQPDAAGSFRIQQPLF